jgi:hypothetical protein
MGGARELPVTFHAGLGLKSQGFADRCDVAPLPTNV